MSTETKRIVIFFIGLLIVPFLVTQLFVATSASVDDSLEKSDNVVVEIIEDK